MVLPLYFCTCRTLAVDVHSVFYLEAVGTVLESWPEEAPPLNFMHAVLKKLSIY